MAVRNSGDATSFTGPGSPNPQKLFIPDKNNMQDPAVQTGMLKLEQWLNSLVSGGFGQISHTYAVSGTISVPSGATGYLPPFFMPNSDGQTEILFGVMTLLRAGTADLSIERNGSVIATGVPCSTSPTFTALLETVANNDYYQPVVTSATGADGLSCSFYFAVTG